MHPSSSHLKQPVSPFNLLYLLYREAQLDTYVPPLWGQSFQVAEQGGEVAGEEVRTLAALALIPDP